MVPTYISSTVIIPNVKLFIQKYNLNRVSFKFTSSKFVRITLIVKYFIKNIGN